MVWMPGTCSEDSNNFAESSAESAPYPAEVYPYLRLRRRLTYLLRARGVGAETRPATSVPWGETGPSMQAFLPYRVSAPSDLTAAGTRRIVPADGVLLITDAGSTVADTQVRVSPLEKEQIC